MTQARHILRRTLLPALLVSAALLGGVAPAMAAPPAAEDPVGRFLSERGMLEAPPPAEETPPAERTLIQQVRHTASDMVRSAMGFLGVPYRRGGSSAEEGFDCSGFTRYVFERSLGLALPRRADDQAGAPSLISVHRDELKPGDLVFFNTLRRTFSHVGIYIGEGKFIHSPRSGSRVRIESLREAYWTKRFTGARRAKVEASGTGASLAGKLSAEYLGSSPAGESPVH